MQLPISAGALLLRIVSYNIRFAATDLGNGEQPWAGVRGPRVINEIRFNTISSPAAIVGMQEVLKEQLDDVLTGLNADRAQSEPEWASLGVGRDDGIAEGEFSPILYRPSVWQLQQNSTVWLSPTPDVPGSIGWDANIPRILTIGTFKHKKTGVEVTAMNTHFDHQGTVARENSARIITEEINKRLSNSTSSPAIILTGDFNSQPGQEAYQYLTQPSSPVFDVSQRIPQEMRYGFLNQTFTGFNNQSSSLLDYVFLNKQGAWKPKTFGVLCNRFDEGFFYSDHQAVITDVELALSGNRAGGNSGYAL